jgi:hypothetical protein
MIPVPAGKLSPQVAVRKPRPALRLTLVQLYG